MTTEFAPETAAVTAELGEATALTEKQRVCDFGAHQVTFENVTEFTYREWIARVLHADDVKHGCADGDFSLMREDAREWYFDNADAVLAAIRGHAPTQDEREALGDVIFDAYAKGGGAVEKAKRAAGDVFGFGFRRQVCSVTETDVEIGTVARANFLRAEHGLPPLSLPDVLTHVNAKRWMAETRAALEAVEANRNNHTNGSGA